MGQPGRLQFLLMRLGKPSLYASPWNPMTDSLSLYEKGARRRELALCALFKSRQRLRTSEAALARALRRIVSHRIQRKLADSRLPSQRAAIITGGPGRGGDCDGCEQPL